MIKSNGGVFGRNPTFNDVTVDGNLTVNGDIALGDDIVVTDTLTVNGITTLASTTESTTKDTGALVVEGGVGIEKRLNVGGNAVINGVSVGAGPGGTNNTVLGSGAGAALVSGSNDNVCIGRLSGDAINEGDQNICIGTNAFGSMLKHSNGIAIGHNALSASVGDGSVLAYSNEAIGAAALRDANTAMFNTAIGYNSQRQNLSGTRNVSVGQDSLVFNESGADNVVIGTSAAGTSGLTKIDRGVYIGRGATASGNNAINEIAIGFLTTGNGSNTTTIGNASTLGTYLPNGTLYVQETDNSTSTTTGALQVAGGVGVGGALHTGDKITAEVTSATTNAAIPVAQVNAQCSGTPAAGFGSAIEFAAETAPGNTEIGARIEGAITDTTSGSEDFALVFKTMSAGAVPAERFRIDTTAGSGQRPFSFTSDGVINRGIWFQSGSYQLWWNSNDGSLGYPSFGTYSNHALELKTNWTNRVTIGTDGNVRIRNGNLILGTSGNGIDFSATGDAGNVPARNAGGGIIGTATAPSNNDTVTVGASVYTFKTALTPANGEVLIGATSQTALTNLTNAINGTGGTPGTDYQVAGANASATGTYSFVSSVPYISLRAITAGSAGNSITLSETSAQLSVTPFAGGADAVTNPIGELLNDYEEGTWDPVLAPTTGSFDIVTMNVYEARYIKVGRMVTLYAAFNANVVVGSASGLIRITGLPYTCVATVAAGTSTGTRYTGSARAQNWTGTRPDAVMLNSNSAFLNLANQGTADYTDTATGNIDERPLGTRQYTVFSITYPAA